MIEKNPSNITDRNLDRLVDGELGEPERRDLLTALDGESDGWRRCALAFLEAQSWRQTLGSMARDKVTPGSQIPASRPRRRNYGTLLAMAASFALALVASALVRPWIFPTSSSRSAGQPSTQITRSTDPQNLPWRMVTVSVPDESTGALRRIQLPAVEQNGPDAAWLGSLPQALPPDVLRAIQRSGHRVEESRQLVPVPMQDGGRLMVPVDQVEVHYVGNRGYQ